MKNYHKPLIILLLLHINYFSNAQTELWGVTSIGGAHKQGCIFKTDSNGNNQQLVYSMPWLSAANPKYSQVVEAPTGKLYFVTPVGGNHYDGTIMEYDPATGILDTAYNFQGPPECRDPYGKMFLASNGKFYGLTYAGGMAITEPGGVYEFDPATLVYTFKLSFDFSNANRSYSSFIEEPTTGKLLSTTYYGGSVGKGVILEYDFNANTFVKKVQFDGTANGAYPVGELFLASNGKYYGMTTEGGLHDKGVIYEYDLALNTLTNKMDFDSVTNGAHPYGGFIEPVPGMLYGLASKGGTTGYGVAFKYNINTSTYTKIHDFDLNANGQQPFGTLLKTANGFLYGNSAFGPLITATGSIFKIDTSNDSLTSIFYFNTKTQGSNSTGSLMQASNGKLYGLCTNGSDYLQGSFYSYDLATGTFSLIAKLDSRPMGRFPYSGLIQATNGLLYGICNYGGYNNTGVIYSIHPVTYNYNVLFSFDHEFPNVTGKWAQARLCQAANGKLYGSTSNGGSQNQGVLFSYDINSGVLNPFHDCAVFTDGRYPKWQMTEALNGKLYGAMETYTTGSGGVIYEVDPATDSFQMKKTFVGTNGEVPSGGLIKSTTGRLFGLTNRGGSVDSGAVYEYVPATDTIILQASFTGGNTGKQPIGSLIEASNGNFYGYAAGGMYNKELFLNVI